MKRGPLHASGGALHKEPLRFVHEFAEEFGVEPRVLGIMLMNDPSAPEGVRYTSSNKGGGKGNYQYPLHATRRWWAQKGIK